MNVTDEIKARLDIVDFIGSYVQLKKSGRSYKGLCPFHSEKTPSFVVFPDSQNWRCFGACAEGGDIFSFVMKREGWDFAQALRFLAERAGVELAPPTPQQVEIREAGERLRALLSEAAAFYNRQLLQAPNAAHARAYVERRGLSADTVARFQLGYAPSSWDATMNLLLELGFQRQDLIDAGMLVEKDDGGIYDRFRDRLMIPIHDVQGELVGFGARALSPDAVPKYLNSPQTLLFDKSQTLYGLAHARRTIRESETAVIVEGYMDVLQAHQAGFANVIAQMGTALTEPQLHLLSRYASRLILALDPDTAGQMATERGREVIERVSKTAAQQAGEEGVWDFDAAEREYHARLTAEFNARGMISYESRLGFDIRVVTLPEGQDPDDLIRSDPQAWAMLIEQAQPIVEYVIRRTIEGQNLDDPKVKSEVARQIVPLIDGIADRIERDHYRQRLARLLKVTESALFAHSAPPARRSGAQRRRQQPVAPPSAEAQPAPLTAPTRSREAFCLAALIHHPRLIYRVDRVLAEYIAAGYAELEGEAHGVLAWHFLPGDFVQPEHRAVFEAWRHALEQDELDPVACLREMLDPVSRELVDHWLELPLYALTSGGMPRGGDFTADEVYETALDGLLTLRKERINEQIEELRFLLEEAENGGSRLTVQEYESTLNALLVARRCVDLARQRAVRT